MEASEKVRLPLTSSKGLELSGHEALRAEQRTRHWIDSDVTLSVRESAVATGMSNSAVGGVLFQLDGEIGLIPTTGYEDLQQATPPAGR